MPWQHWPSEIIWPAQQLPQSLPEGAIPFSSQPLCMENTQVYPPLRARCKCPIRPNESSAQASKEGETVANAQYFSMTPLPRGGCNYCVGFNIIKPICSSCTQHPGASLCLDLWTLQPPYGWQRPELEK